MNILITGDSPFVKPLATLVYSISKNTPKDEKNAFFCPYIKRDELTTKEKKSLQKNIRANDEITFFQVPDTCLINVKENKNKWNYQVWLKLLCLFYLPKQITKMLYIDADCIVNSSLLDLYNNDIKNTIFLGINEKFGDNKQNLNRIKIKPDGKYICGGVLLINPLLFKRNLKNVDYVVQLYKKLPFDPLFNEQDFINYYYHDSLVALDDIKYMFFTQWYKYNKSDEIIIYHYAGYPKPWDIYNFQYHKAIFITYWKYGKHTYGFLYYCVVIIKSYWLCFYRFLKKIVKRLLRY